MALTRPRDIEWFGLHPPSVLFVPLPPPLPPPAQAHLQLALEPPRARAEASRFAFVCESSGAPSPSSPAFAGLLGALSYAAQARQKTRWWVVAFLKTATRPRRHLSSQELLARLAPHYRLVGPLLNARTDARAFATFERNLRRARGYMRIELV